MQRRHAAGVRLDLGDLAAVDPAQPGDLVLATPPLELVESRQLGLVGGDDQLAVAPRLDPALVAVGVEQPGALDAEPRLERAGGVVDAGVDDAARVGGLVGGEPVLALEHAEGRVRVPGEQLAGDREPEDAAADDDDVASGGGSAMVGRD